MFHNTIKKKKFHSVADNHLYGGLEGSHMQIKNVAAN